MDGLSKIAGSLEDCDFSYTMSAISGKFKIAVLYCLHERGVVRFNELKRIIPSVSFKMLSSTLREMQADGLVNREEFPQIPPKVEYSLTKRGESLMPVLDSLCEWGRKHKADSIEKGASL